MKVTSPIPPYEYLKGNEFVENLKEVLNCRSHQELADLLHVPKSTFSTWSKHGRTSHELMVRLHLALGIPIEDLALPKNKYSLVNAATASGKTEHFLKFALDSIAESNTQIVKSYCLTNGKLLETGKVPYSERRINGFGLENAELIEIETNQSVVLVDKKENDAMNGNYLIAIDGRYSINQVQRLPGKLAIAFDGQTIEVQEGDIEVIGKVVLETKLK
ncbi:phage repressor protein CI [Vibrio fluvialis]|nr:phage repressor protein CI [Vibrio fluvialis]